MTRTAQMLDAHPRRLPRSDKRLLVACIDACMESAQAATACVDSCLAEPNIAELTSCVTSAVNCADLCAVTGRVLSRQTLPDQALLATLLTCCAQASRACAEACAPLVTDYPYCEVCLLACRHAEQSCLDLIDAQG